MRQISLTSTLGTALVARVATLPDHIRGHMTVLKSPDRGCCSGWTDIAGEHGFDIRVEERKDMTSLKREAGVTQEIECCHTAMVEGYVVDGHVPMEAIDKLLTSRPFVVGVSAPGMPAGSSGMGDDPMTRFDLLSFGAKDGRQPVVFFEAGAD